MFQIRLRRRKPAAVARSHLPPPCRVAEEVDVYDCWNRRAAWAIFGRLLLNIIHTARIPPEHCPRLLTKCACTFHNNTVLQTWMLQSSRWARQDWDPGAPPDARLPVFRRMSNRQDLPLSPLQQASACQPTCPPTCPPKLRPRSDGGSSVQRSGGGSSLRASEGWSSPVKVSQGYSQFAPVKAPPTRRYAEAVLFYCPSTCYASQPRRQRARRRKGHLDSG